MLHIQIEKFCLRIILFHTDGLIVLEVYASVHIKNYYVHFHNPLKSSVHMEQKNLIQSNAYITIYRYTEHLKKLRDFLCSIWNELFANIMQVCIKITYMHTS